MPMYPMGMKRKEGVEPKHQQVQGDQPARAPRKMTARAYYSPGERDVAGKRSG